MVIRGNCHLIQTPNVIAQPHIQYNVTVYLLKYCICIFISVFHSGIHEALA